jgi:microcystin-dependent protein
MSSPFIGEIRMFAGNFAPAGWAFCDGRLIPIDQNEALFALIGTTYGGDGQSTFALPDLRSRVPIHAGPGFVLGQQAGVETVTLSLAQIPAHSHVPQGNTSPTASSPAENVWAGGVTNSYSTAAPNANMDPGALGSAGGSQPHDNMLPFLAINFILSLFGIFPSQT